ncbi:Rpn family recombination-promoting nuclease/putative transposase [Adlercreutzia caecimuris]|uniref:Rpn family recombination-promoting nuclease/putative transposase n=1 Tax=Adlercreutzia caecimuris TaxID=671266 RepID=UPI00272C84C4|nr:Rpn family recombination-promoting nuclease/putative transposase [Adlercreutzia caecimuris]
MRDLTFSDGPMFQRLMSNREICRGIVERILNTRISEVENIVTEQIVEPRLGGHGVRMDAVLTSDGETYDIEMQTYRRGRVAKRLRYYQASLDVATLGRGSDYDRLPRTYVVFICTNDFLGTGLPVNTLQISCIEQPSFDCGHDFRWVILDASKWSSLESGPLQRLLQFVDTGTAPHDDLLLSLISREMAAANADAAWKEEMMPFLTLEEDAKIQARISYEDGKAEGRLEGQQRMGALIQRLLADGRTEDLEAAASDPALCSRLCEEYGL